MPFGQVLGRFGGRFWVGVLRILLNRLVSRGGNKGNVRMFKNTCVFAVRLHLGLIDKARAELARTSSSFISEQYPSGSASGAPMWRHFGVPKSVPKRCRSHVEPMLLERCNVNVFLLLQKRGGRIPGTTPPPFCDECGASTEWPFWMDHR